MIYFKWALILVLILGFIFGFKPEWLIGKKININPFLVFFVLMPISYLLKRFIFNSDYMSDYMLLLHVFLFAIFMGSVVLLYLKKEKKKLKD